MMLKLIVTIFIVLSVNLTYANGNINFSGAITESTYRTNNIGKHLKNMNRSNKTTNSISDINNKLFNVKIDYLNKERNFAITQVTYK